MWLQSQWHSYFAQSKVMLRILVFSRIFRVESNGPGQRDSIRHLRQSIARRIRMSTDCAFRLQRRNERLSPRCRSPPAAPRAMEKLQTHPLLPIRSKLRFYIPTASTYAHMGPRLPVCSIWQYAHGNIWRNPPHIRKIRCILRLRIFIATPHIDGKRRRGAHCAFVERRGFMPWYIHASQSINRRPSAIHIS